MQTNNPDIPRLTKNVYEARTKDENVYETQWLVRNEMINRKILSIRFSFTLYTSVSCHQQG